MKRAKLEVTRQPLRLSPDHTRVLARPFFVGDKGRLLRIIERVLALPDAELKVALKDVLAAYGHRHSDIRRILLKNFAGACAMIGRTLVVAEERRLLLGAYFSQEYSLESAALFNPSMVPHPDQSGVAPGAKRFVMSLRACGEGHISSIEFRTGMVDANQQVALDATTRFATAAGPVEDARFDKSTYARKLREMAAYSAMAEPILAQLGDGFTMRELVKAIAHARPRGGATTLYNELGDNMVWLARSNYHVDFSADTRISERVIFPVTENESRGIEDARFVRFVEPDGRVVYYATYSAYNGFRVLPQLIETTDFCYFKINTLNGRCVQNKGMALFPRKIGKDFVMSARIDGENLFILRSENVHFWEESVLIQRPKHDWDIVQLGNCGSPIETEAGWLLLTHGVGPMRQYSIGAVLLDLEDPSRVIGELAHPLLTPNADERDGYVPNVVYSCGAMRNGDHLVIPFAVSDAHTTFATVSIPELLAAMT